MFYLERYMMLLVEVSKPSKHGYNFNSKAYPMVLFEMHICILKHYQSILMIIHVFCVDIIRHCLYRMLTGRECLIFQVNVM